MTYGGLSHNIFYFIKSNLVFEQGFLILLCIYINIIFINHT